MLSKDIFNNFKPYFQDTCSLGLALFVCFAVYYYKKYENAFYIKIASVVCIFYSIFDLYSGATIDFWIHHIAQFVLCAIAAIWHTKANDVMQYIYYCLLVEVSSIFFSFRSLFRTYLKQNSDSNITSVKIIKQAQPINELLFFTTFMYTRIYLFNKNVVFNPEFYSKVYATFDFYMTGKMITVCTAVLSIINLYWSKFLIKRFITKACGRDITEYKPDPKDPFLMEIEAAKAKLLK